MLPMTHVILLLLTVIFVCLLTSKMAPQNHLAAGLGAVIFFCIHPLVLSGAQGVAVWDAFYVIIFCFAWKSMVNWSPFMRSWILAGFYAFGVWVGSAFVLWIPLAMLPWVFFSRRPGTALASLLTIVLGGFAFYGAVWGLSWLLRPEIGRPVFLQWIRWQSFHSPLYFSLSWSLLVLLAFSTKFQQVLQERRTGVTMIMATLLCFILLFGASTLALAKLALSVPLVAAMLSRRDFLFQRTVRSTAAFAFLLSIALILLRHQLPGAALSLGVVGVGLLPRYLRKGTPLPWRLTLEACCVGIYLAESTGSLFLQ